MTSSNANVYHDRLRGQRDPCVQLVAGAALAAQLNLQARGQRRVQEIHDVLGENDKILTDDETLSEKMI